ncbi:MAG TPA: cytochrome c [Stellaceae bacterium]|nr:cytochrome c [Stellaceae bacterium]
MTRALAAAALLMIAVAGCAFAQENDPVARGAYLVAAAGCATCHTDKKNGGPPFAGGAALTTPFGVFYGKNITPAPRFGIGTWTEAQFHRALRDGIDDDDHYMYPVFPFTSYTGMTDQDISDIYAFLKTQKPVPQRAKRHDIKFPFEYRPLLFFWRTLFFTPGPLDPVAGKDAQWNRGRYLVEAVAHCEECHTPRNFLGALERDHAFAGNPDGPDGQKAPNITPDPETGIGKWSIADIVGVLKDGITPDGDSVGSGMADVVEGTGKLTDADLQAIATYIKSVPPLRATGK